MILLPFKSVFYNSIHDKDGKPFAACVTDEDNPTGEMFVYCASPEEEAVTTSVMIDRMKLRGFWEFSRTNNSSVSDAQLLYAQYAEQYQNNRLTDLEKALLKHLEEKKRP